jgi:hypothetical protein
MSVDGQVCGTQTPTGRHGDWVQVVGAVPIVVRNNNPEVVVLVTVPNPTADVVAWSLDDVRVGRTLNSGLPTCSA